MKTGTRTKRALALAHFPVPPFPSFALPPLRVIPHLSLVKTSRNSENRAGYLPVPSTTEPTAEPVVVTFVQFSDAAWLCLTTPNTNTHTQTSGRKRTGESGTPSAPWPLAKAQARTICRTSPASWSLRLPFVARSCACLDIIAIR